jgi:probable HAF family extracellular repeat protein
MKYKTWSFVIALALFSALTITVQLAAQDKEDNHQQHHRYKLIDLGTLGGTQSYIESNPPEKIISLRGAVAAFADTSAPDPYNPNCFNTDCLVSHTVVWQGGVLTDLGALPGGSSSFASSINERGEIVGASQNGQIDPLTASPEAVAILWENGITHNLGTLGGNQGVANAINDRGQVAGGALNAIPDAFAGIAFTAAGSFAQTFLFAPAATDTHAFLWSDGKMQDLGTLGGPDSTGVAINDSGEIAGQSFTNFIANPSGVPTIDPFFWENGKMVDIGTLGGTYGFANGLNNRGQVVGTSNLAGDLANHAFLWDKKEGLKDLGIVEGYTATSIAYWANDDGEVVGESDSTTASRAFLWKNGVMSDLGTVAGDACSVALSINSQGQIVGFGSADCYNEDHGFLSENGGPIVDLGALILPGSDLRLIEAVYINDRGEIAGRGKLSNDDERALVLLPCDENHPDIEGCDYETVDTDTAPQLNAAPIALAPAGATSAKLSHPETMERHNHHFGFSQFSPK